MTSTIKVDTIQDSGGNTIISSDGSGTITQTASIGSFSSTGIDDNASSTAITIDSSQRVGIGTSSPNHPITVEAGNNSGIRANATSNNISLMLTDSTGNDGFRVNYNAPNNALTFDNTTGDGTFISERMRIDSLGFLGIGTTSVTSQLTVYRTSSSTTNGALQLDGNGNYAGVRFASSGSQKGSIGADNSVLAITHQNNLYFATGSSDNVGGTERMRIDSSGNVGIGAVPGAWDTSPILQIDNAAFRKPTVDFQMINNAIRKSTGWEYLDTGYSQVYTQSGLSGYHQWFYAPSGTAGNTVTFTEAMRIDSSGNVLVGTTSSSIYNDTSGNGIQLNGGTGQIVVAKESTSSADPALWLNNTGVGGNIVTFAKDGSSVGSIYSRFGTTLGINGGTTFTIGSNSNSDVIYVDFIGPPKAVYANPDNTYDLGTSSKRWQDLYLSGSVYLGGTGSANGLDDYEEGTFTPAIAGWTLGSAVGIYTKIGNTVFYEIRTGTLTGSGTGTLEITGLPFVPVAAQASGTVMASYVNWNAATVNLNVYTTTASKARIYQSQDNTGWAVLQEQNLISGSSILYLTGTYSV